jgi:hypothetical protein
MGSTQTETYYQSLSVTISYYQLLLEEMGRTQTEAQRMIPNKQYIDRDRDANAAHVRHGSNRQQLIVTDSN